MAAFLTVCVLGALVHFALNTHARPFRWAATSAQRIKKLPPDLNHSTAAELEVLPGIGPKTARAIIDYRLQHGPFLRLEELRRVKGVSKRTIQQIEQYYMEEGQRHE